MGVAKISPVHGVSAKLAVASQCCMDTLCSTRGVWTSLLRLGHTASATNPCTAEVVRNGRHGVGSCWQAGCEQSLELARHVLSVTACCT